MLSEEWDLILKHRASEIRVKRIRVNQGLGVSLCPQLIELYLFIHIASEKSSLPLKDGKNMEMPKCTNLANVPEKR